MVVHLPRVVGHTTDWGGFPTPLKREALEGAFRLFVRGVCSNTSRRHVVVGAWVRMILLGPNLIRELLLQWHDGLLESRWHDGCWRLLTLQKNTPETRWHR